MSHDVAIPTRSLCWRGESIGCGQVASDLVQRFSRQIRKHRQIVRAFAACIVQRTLALLTAMRLCLFARIFCQVLTTFRLSRPAAFRNHRSGADGNHGYTTK